MSTKRVTQKDPHEWITGDEPMTHTQETYLKALAQKAGVKVSENLSKAEASETIEKLKKTTGPGVSHAISPRTKKTSPTSGASSVVGSGIEHMDDNINFHKEQNKDDL